MVNKKFVEEKIKLIEREFDDLEKLSKFSFQEIVSDFLKQNSLERILEKIINRAIDINQHLIAELSKEELPPQSYRETFLKLAELRVYPKEFAQNIAKSVGTRNILVHDYNKVDYSQIYSSMSDCLKDYHQYCDYILKFLEKNNP
jgi:uncharacterized protein YutE (UPF0331/DUF86 family)